ncbi:DUF1707 domain-containing protein [Nocardia puris]|uniref:Uncharacterized protein DUF1707 n=1 Tax=Nocardia puris TaxID=208602 RepID=A0A366D8G3_9NOCA|nr:DUF1707 domain-containing protein [Nocardia puris]MBF6212344.1 DUF1707 domain-containing protein [Nocardia puris]MBF6366591.1 DUF1707 domain-containing protein [Nocardia puris]MBF6460933.1 DUF1707 domain-containing protein [Nocardia puris]RBO85578.1 uncharacterized protein DUF1707 [Nocardia puris]
MDQPPDIRIGTEERERAMRRLSDNFAAGRLSVAEFDERSAVIANARTRGELEPVFSDLPPEPSQDKAPARRDPALLGDWPERVMAAIPIVAVILFFVTGSWLWFLAIPLAGALLFGKRHGGH